jgi:hypothetical protein
VFRFDDEDPQGSPTPARYSADILRIRQDDTLRGGDPLVVLYEKRWPDSFDDGLPSELATTAADLGRFIGATWSFKDAVEPHTTATSWPRRERGTSSAWGRSAPTS